MLKLISINVERSKHLDVVIPFLEKEQADVVCVQELMEWDIPALEKATGASSVFSREVLYDNEREKGVQGCGIFSRSGFVVHRDDVYHGGKNSLRPYDSTDIESKRQTQDLKVISADIEKNGIFFRIATTHFTWTPDGEADDYQRKDLVALFEILGAQGDFVLTGDFNAPRGKEIFSAIAAKYKDNVPLEYTSSIDGSLHRAGALPYMVDGMFSTPRYRVENVRMVSGVSDHCALVGEVSIASL